MTKPIGFLVRLARIADLYDAAEDDAHKVWCDVDKAIIRDLSLGECREAREVLNGNTEKRLVLARDLIDASTVSCSRKEITIACDDHDTKDALMDILTGGPRPAQAGSTP